MTIDGDIRDFLLKIPSTFDLSQRNYYIQQCIVHFQNVYGYLESREDYSEKDVSEGIGNLFNSFAHGYWTAGFVAGETFWGFSGRLYALWLRKSIQFQEKHSKRIHKGMAYNQLGWINLNYYKNNAKAYDYYLCALIEDIVSEREFYVSSPAFIALTTSLFELQKDKVFRIKEEIAKLKINKLIPENIITVVNNKVAIPTYDELSSLDVQRLESLKAYWERFKEESQKITVSIGREFEKFAEMFFTMIRELYSRGSGVAFAISTGRKEHDYDLIIYNKSSLFPELGNYLIVECKFQKRKIGYEDLSKFFHKLHTKRCSAGILFTMEGIKDGNKNTTLREIYDNDGILILVFDKNDIDAVINGKENLATMIRIKYEQIRFRTN